MDLLVLRHSARSRDITKSNAENAGNTPSLVGETGILIIDRESVAPFKFPDSIHELFYF